MEVWLTPAGGLLPWEERVNGKCVQAAPCFIGSPLTIEEGASLTIVLMPGDYEEVGTWPAVLYISAGASVTIRSTDSSVVVQNILWDISGPYVTGLEDSYLPPSPSFLAADSYVRFDSITLRSVAQMVSFYSVALSNVTATVSGFTFSDVTHATVNKFSWDAPAASYPVYDAGLVPLTFSPRAYTPPSPLEASPSASQLTIVDSIFVCSDGSSTICLAVVEVGMLLAYEEGDIVPPLLVNFTQSRSNAGFARFSYFVDPVRPLPLQYAIINSIILSINTSEPFFDFSTAANIPFGNASIFVADSTIAATAQDQKPLLPSDGPPNVVSLTFLGSSELSEVSGAPSYSEFPATQSELSTTFIHRVKIEFRLRISPLTEQNFYTENAKFEDSFVAINTIPFVCRNSVFVTTTKGLAASTPSSVILFNLDHVVDPIGCRFEDTSVVSDPREAFPNLYLASSSFVPLLGGNIAHKSIVVDRLGYGPNVVVNGIIDVKSVISPKLLAVDYITHTYTLTNPPEADQDFSLPNEPTSTEFSHFQQGWKFRSNAKIYNTFFSNVENVLYVVGSLLSRDPGVQVFNYNTTRNLFQSPSPKFGIVFDSDSGKPILGRSYPVFSTFFPFEMTISSVVVAIEPPVSSPDRDLFVEIIGNSALSGVPLLDNVNITFVVKKFVCPLPAPLPLDLFFCDNGVWVFITSSNSTTPIVIGTPVTIVGNFTPTDVTFNGLGSTITVDGCVTLPSGKVTLVLTPSELEALLKDKNKYATLINSQCATKGSVDINIQTPKKLKKCQKITGKLESSGKSLRAVITLDSSKCNIWWIVLVSVIGGVILILLILALIFTFNQKTKACIRPYLARNKGKPA